MVQKFGKLTSWGWQFIPVFAGFYIHPNGGFLAGFQPSTVLLNFASRFYFGLAMFHHFAVKITPPMKQTRFFFMNLGFFPHQLYSIFIISMVIASLAYVYGGVFDDGMQVPLSLPLIVYVNLPPVQDDPIGSRIVGCECQMSMSLERQLSVCILMVYANTLKWYLLTILTRCSSKMQVSHIWHSLNFPIFMFSFLSNVCIQHMHVHQSHIHIALVVAQTQ